MSFKDLKKKNNLAILVFLLFNITLIYDLFFSKEFFLEGIFVIGIVVLSLIKIASNFFYLKIHKYFLYFLNIFIILLQVFFFIFLSILLFGYGFSGKTIHLVWYSAVILNSIMLVLTIKEIQRIK